MTSGEGEGLEQASDVTASDLDPDVLDRVERVARTVAYSVVQHESHAGPMPSPRDFALYDKVLPGTAQTIRDEFVKNAEHIRALQGVGMQYQKDDSDKNRKSAERLVWGAFVLILVLAMLGHEKAAIAVAISVVGAVVAGFLNRRHRSKQREQNDGSDES